MLPVASPSWGLKPPSNGATRVGAARQLARRGGRTSASAVAVLLLIGGSSLLLYNRITVAQGAQEPGSHVVSNAEGQGTGGTAAGVARRTQLLEQAAQQQHARVQTAKQLAEEVQQLAQEVQQKQRGGSSGGGGRDGPLFGDGSGVQLQGSRGTAAAAARSSSGQAAAAGAAGGRLSQRMQQQRQNLLQAAGGGRAGAVAAAAAANVPPRPDPPIVELTAAEVVRRREEIKGAMAHAWRGYEQYAWGHDELCPVSKQGKDSFGGLGATIVDAMDTLHMMGMQAEYDRAAEWVRTSLPLNASFDASVFETIIRVVGGMLAAHDLTGDAAMLLKAQQVADRLLPAYRTPTAIPYNIINLATQAAKNPAWNQMASTLAEFGTHQLEFWQLSQRTGNATYGELAEATIQRLHKGWPGQGLMPLFISPKTGNFTARRISFGALGDSYYEYLLKMWLLKGKQDDMYRTMWEQAMDEMSEKLVFKSKEGLTYIAEFDKWSLKHKFDHLVCFVPGMLALGAHSGAVQGAKAERYIQLAADLAHTCWQMYHRQPTGLSPEYVTFTAQQGMRVGAAYNMLRPEALEAFFYMWRMTHDWRYRAWGWEVFLAFQQHCKAEAGYSGVKDVRLPSPVRDDTQQSFFLAETLKYLYLLFSDDDALDLDEWVLNTEAHPLRISHPTHQQQGRQQGQQQQRKRRWWPPARGKDGGGTAVARQRRRQQR